MAEGESVEEANAFYEGIFSAVNSMVAGQRPDHMDFLLPDLLWTSPKTANIRGLLNHMAYADEGGVLDEVLIRQPDGRAILRVIDVQDGPNYRMPQARYDELCEGQFYLGEVEDGG